MAVSRPASAVLLLLLSLAAAEAALPKGWKACSRSAKDYDACLAREVKAAISTLIDGEKKLGVYPLDPLRISQLDIPKSPGPVNLDLKFRDLDVHGIKDLKINKIRNNWKDLDAVVHIPELPVLGNYKVDGKVLVLPITGSGKCNLTFHELTLNIKVHWKSMEKNGKKYFQMEKMDLELVPEKLYINLTNLFNGDKALGDNMNVFLNENYKEILEELKPGISEGLSKAFTQISNAVLSRIPADEIDKK